MRSGCKGPKFTFSTGERNRFEFPANIFRNDQGHKILRNYALELKDYSGGNRKVYEYRYMKQKCQLQMGTAQNENTATPLRTSGIDTT